MPKPTVKIVAYNGRLSAGSPMSQWGTATARAIAGQVRPLRAGELAPKTVRSVYNWHSSISSRGKGASPVDIVLGLSGLARPRMTARVRRRLKPWGEASNLYGGRVLGAGFVGSGGGSGGGGSIPTVVAASMHAGHIPTAAL